MLQKQTLDKLASEAVVVKAANITTALPPARQHHMAAAPVHVLMKSQDLFLKSDHFRIMFVL